MLFFEGKQKAPVQLMLVSCAGAEGCAIVIEICYTLYGSRPAGVISLRAAISKPPWRITSANLDFTLARCWRTGSTKPEATNCSAPSAAFACLACLWVAEKFPKCCHQAAMYHDSWQRNSVEGHIGCGKRRFGLDCIFSKLDEIAKTESASTT